jgi:phosphoribosylformimino-5-aminoimidazole carboxamide ribotide isomerase
MNVIPAIDLRAGSCVRLHQGEFDRQTEYSKDPVDVGKHFESFGFSNLHVVDLDGARSGQQRNERIVRRLAQETGFSIQLGGGIRDSDKVSAWLEAGVDRCVIGSVAVTEPRRVRDWLQRFGPARIVLALDVRLDEGGVPRLATHGWTQDSEHSLWQVVEAYRESGLEHVLCTDISRDGAMSGPSVDLYRDFLERFPGIALQASGGVRDIRDLETLRAAGAAAAITGRALLDGRISREEITSFLPAA